MILFSFGTIQVPFLRLASYIESRMDQISSTQKNIIIQSGFTEINKKIETVSFFPYEQMIYYYQNADVVVSAAGEGSALTLLKYSKTKPILFPRLKKYKEHVNDQQLHISNHLKKKNYVTVAKNKKELDNLIFKEQPLNTNLDIFDPNRSELVKNLRKKLC